MYRQYRRHLPEIPAHDRVFHIFSSKITMAAKCDKSPTSRKMFILAPLTERPQPLERRVKLEWPQLMGENSIKFKTLFDSASAAMLTWNKMKYRSFPENLVCFVTKIFRETPHLALFRTVNTALSCLARDKWRSDRECTDFAMRDVHFSTSHQALFFLGHEMSN